MDQSNLMLSLTRGLFPDIFSHQFGGDLRIEMPEGDCKEQQQEGKEDAGCHRNREGAPFGGAHP